MMRQPAGGQAATAALYLSGEIARCAGSSGEYVRPVAASYPCVAAVADEQGLHLPVVAAWMVERGAMRQRPSLQSGLLLQMQQRPPSRFTEHGALGRRKHEIAAALDAAMRADEEATK